MDKRNEVNPEKPQEELCLYPKRMALLEKQVKEVQVKFDYLLVSYIEIWRGEKDSAGNLVRPDFDELVEVMRDLLESEQASSIEEGYKIAKRIAGQADD